MKFPFLWAVAARCDLKNLRPPRCPCRWEGGRGGGPELICEQEKELDQIPELSVLSLRAR